LQGPGRIAIGPFAWEIGFSSAQAASTKLLLRTWKTRPVWEDRMKKQPMAVPVRALSMYLAERDFGNPARSAFNEAAASFIHKRAAAVPSKNFSRL
jgi:hypothetical protein